MTHEECLDVLSAYMDGEVEAAQAAEIDGHLATCASCSARLAQYRQLSSAIGDSLRRQAVTEPAPVALRERVVAALSAADATATSPWVAAQRRPRRPWRASTALLATAAVVLLAAVGVRVAGVGQPGREGISQEVLDSHIRSMAGDEAHLMDVASTDQHTVKPWFEGKLDFAPTVTDFSAEGFPLLGGRVDYLDGRRVAALVYGRRQHKINVYEWPADDRRDQSPTGELRLGYSVLHWTHAGIVFWAVSDVNPSDLNELARNLDAPGR